MKLKKTLAVLSAAVMVMGSSGITAFAEEPEQEIGAYEIMEDEETVDTNPEAKYAYAISVTSNITPSNGFMTGQSGIIANSRTTKIITTQYYEMKNGSDWSVIRAWRQTAYSNSNVVMNTCPQKSGTYRLRTVFKVFAGSKYETITKYSRTVNVSAKKRDADTDTLSEEEIVGEIGTAEIKSDGPADASMYAASALSKLIILDESNGAMKAQSIMTAKNNVTAIYTSQYLEQLFGDEWMTVHSWQRGNGGNEVTHGNKMTVTTSGTYRLRSVFELYVGNKYETVTVYSDAVNIDIKENNVSLTEPMRMASDKEMELIGEAIAEYDASLGAEFKKGNIGNVYKMVTGGYITSSEALVLNRPLDIADISRYFSEDELIHGAKYVVEIGKNKVVIRKDPERYNPKKEFNSSGPNFSVVEEEESYAQRQERLLKTAKEIKADTGEDIVDIKFMSAGEGADILYFKTQKGAFMAAYWYDFWTPEYDSDLLNLIVSGKVYEAEDFLDRMRCIMGPCATEDLGMKPSEKYEKFKKEGLKDPHNYPPIFGLTNTMSRSTGILGDVNVDGKVTVRDCTALASMIARRGLLNTEVCDYNKDGTVNIRDAAAIANDLAKK